MSEITKYDYYTPFLNRHRAKHIDGIYRHKDDHTLLKLKNMYFQGMICGDTQKPFDAYQGEITTEGHAPVRKCLMDFFELSKYEKVF